MKLSSQSINRIQEAVRSVLAHYPARDGQPAITDIYLQPKSAPGELVLWDDDDQELACVPVEEWAEYAGDDFYNATQSDLQLIVKQLEEEGCLDKVNLMKPYSLTLVDEERETVAELLLVDDDTLMLDDDLLKGLDEELDAFLKDLLEK